MAVRPASGYYADHTVGFFWSHLGDKNRLPAESLPFLFHNDQQQEALPQNWAQRETWEARDLLWASPVLQLFFGGASDELYRAYVSFEKQHGDGDAIEEAKPVAAQSGNPDIRNL